MDVPAVKMIFIDAHYTFVKGVDTCYRHGAAET
jgi:hypothetical protein